MPTEYRGTQRTRAQWVDMFDSQSVAQIARLILNDLSGYSTNRDGDLINMIAVVDALFIQAAKRLSLSEEANKVVEAAREFANNTDRGQTSLGNDLIHAVRMLERSELGDDPLGDWHGRNE